MLPPLAVGARRPGSRCRDGVDASAVTLGAGGRDAGRGRPAAAKLGVASRATALLSATATFGPPLDAAAGPARPGGPAGGRPAGGALAAQLDIVARCINAGVPTRVYAVSASAVRHPRGREGDPDPAAGPARLGRRRLPGPAGRDPRGATWWSRSTPSSAGGSARTPARAPTTARPGRCSSSAPAVQGGFYGDQPSLTDLDAGDLKSPRRLPVGLRRGAGEGPGHRRGAGCSTAPGPRWSSCEAQ